MSNQTWESTWDTINLTSGTASKIDRAIRAGWNFKLCDKDGNTILHRIAGWTHSDVIQKCIDAGADVNALNKDHETPLFRAIQTRNRTNMRVFLRNEANRNVTNVLGLGPMYFALLQGPVFVDDLCSYATFGIAKSKLFNPNKLNKFGNNQLQELVEGMPEKFIHISKDSLELLFNHGLNINNQNKLGNSLMHMILNKTQTIVPRKGLLPNLKPLLFCLLSHHPKMKIANKNNQTSLDLLKQASSLIPLFAEFANNAQAQQQPVVVTQYNTPQPHHIAKEAKTKQRAL